MNNRSRRPRYYTRRRRRPALLGTAAFASVIVLALGGLTLVGLDTVSSSGKQLSRVVQPEVVQAPQVAEESAEAGEQASASREESSGEEAPEKSSDDMGSKKDQKESEEASSDNSEKSKKAEEKKEQEKKEEDPPAPPNNNMWMSIPSLGMQGDTVYNSSQPSVMDVGAIKLPPTGFPWEDNANTYIAAHRIGYPGTESYNQFYNLPAMQMNDVIYVGDSNGTVYEYRVTNKFAVSPWETWVTEPQPQGDMITLQTCVTSPHPSDWWTITPQLFELGPDTGRLIVQAERVETYPAQSD
jgi:sortase A